MRNFFEDKYINVELKRKLINLISEISEYKGKLDSYQEQRPDIFNNSEKIIPLHYMKNYTTIYTDKKISSKRIKELILNNKVPESVAEDAIFCYYQTLAVVHQKSSTFSISPEAIQELHFQVMNFYTSDSGIWRQKPLSIPEFKDSGIHINNYHQFPHELIPQTVEDLCSQYNSLYTNKELHSLLLIARFILNFYCVVPFSHGNGRLTQILMHLLLLKNGHTFAKYVCLDKYINEKQSEYYNAVCKSSVNWYCNEHNISFWLKSFLTIILEAYKDLHNRIQDSICNQSKVERIQNFVYTQKQPFTQETISSVYPDIAKSTISKTLNTLQLSGEVTLVSKGRNAHWMKVSP
ncbi:Fic family protein [Bacillus cereus]|nr:Fic family protein [Bacillus cereus]MEC3258162.1 Fic family protein [Bacillus cereus]